MFGRMDEWLVQRTQNAYLWIFDRTGVYVPTVFMVVFMVGYVMFFWYYGWKPDYVAMAIICITGMFQGVLYLEQDRGHHEVFNARARHWRDTGWRTSLLVVACTFMTLDILTMKPLMALSFLCDVVCYGYLACVQIRKREPPERHALQPATQGVQ